MTFREKSLLRLRLMLHCANRSGGRLDSARHRRPSNEPDALRGEATTTSTASGQWQPQAHSEPVAQGQESKNLSFSLSLPGVLLRGWDCRCARADRCSLLSRERAQLRPVAPAEPTATARHSGGSPAQVPRLTGQVRALSRRQVTRSSTVIACIRRRPWPRP